MLKARIYFTYYGRCDFGDDPKLFIDWYQHAPTRKSYGKPYEGFSIRLRLLGHIFDISFVSNGAIYKDYMTWIHSSAKRRLDKLNKKNQIDSITCKQCGHRCLRNDLINEQGWEMGKQTYEVTNGCPNCGINQCEASKI